MNEATINRYPVRATIKEGTTYEEGDWTVSFGPKQIYDFRSVKNALEGNDDSCFAVYTGFSETLQLPLIYAETVLCDGETYYAPIIFLNDSYALEIAEILNRVSTDNDDTDTEQEDSNPEESEPKESEPVESFEPITYFTSGGYRYSRG